jgi:CBS domain containing-hemolysin-like protein
MKKDDNAVTVAAAIMLVLLSVVFSMAVYAVGAVILAYLWNSFAVPNWDVVALTWLQSFLIIIGLRFLVGCLIPRSI